MSGQIRTQADLSFHRTATCGGTKSSKKLVQMFVVEFEMSFLLQNAIHLLQIFMSVCPFWAAVETRKLESDETSQSNSECRLVKLYRLSNSCCLFATVKFLCGKRHSAAVCIATVSCTVYSFTGAACTSDEKLYISTHRAFPSLKFS